MSEGAGGQRRRFEALDAVRGVCAIAVMVFHSTFVTGYQPFPSAYLAVDIFFIMSGFVIAHAYEAKLQRGGYRGAFIWRRYARLAPMWIIGLAVGTAANILLHHHDPGIVATTLYVIPALGFIPDPSSSLDIFPNDMPGWSLFAEIVANIVYALFLYRLSTRLLGLVALLGAALVIATIGWRGGINAGAHWDGWEVGLVRICFDFPLGLIFFRLRDRLAGGAWSPVLIVVALAGLLALNHVSLQGGEQQVFDICGMFLICPAVVWCGLNVRATGAWLPEALGLVSYPLYVIHFPAMMVLSYVWPHLHPSQAWPVPLAVAAAFMLCLLPVAWALGRYADPFLQRLLVRQATRVGGFAYGPRALPGDN